MSLHKSVVELCQRRGFVFSGSGIHGGLANSFDYGPLGTALKNNIRNAWWKDFIESRPECVGLDTAIIMNPKVWEAAGHVKNFSDPLVECKKCHHRHRVDHFLEKHGIPLSEDVVQQWNKGSLSVEKRCPQCGCLELGEAKNFNMMFRTSMSTVKETADNNIYLRPETAQGVYVNFPNIARTTRSRLPLGVGQVGKSFRNEISAGPFTFRTKEFEQMELQYFCHPDQASKWYTYWVEQCHSWLLGLGLLQKSVRLRQYSDSELAHYSRATTDIEFEFGFGWGELWGIADRGDYDLKQHQLASGADMSYRPDLSEPGIVPHVVEPALGLDRLVLAVLTDAFVESMARGDSRNLLRLDGRIAPYEVAVFPLMGRDVEQTSLATDVFRRLVVNKRAGFDDKGSIGRRYRRHDEIGTPFCVTVDKLSLQDQTVTLRCRDSMKQVRLPIEHLTSVTDINRLFNELQRQNQNSS